jgi:very-short-patch-repair endonuclease
MKHYPHYIIEVARELRQRATLAEKLLWKELRDHKLAGLKFRRQHPIGRYIVDFYCAKLRLVVELEGGVHDLPTSANMTSVDLKICVQTILRYSVSRTMKSSITCKQS